ncbi:F-box protein At5g49610-like [Mercurialis annua]|uniref:F-box protein At5g49610-like n=1 Tax=Mercurialis annua TaxID=3986 RepID=UPI00215E1453|nr:F-box protein At5g49610-like [Mercurialis annua]
MKKTSKTRRRKTGSTSISSSQPFLPLEIITQILIRLPIESLLRMKAVCKSWHDLLSKDRYFLENHILHCSIHLYQDDEFELVCGQDGLVLTKSKVTSKYWIHNPITKHSMILPDPRHKDHIYMKMLYVPSTNEYKLVSAYANGVDNEGFELLTLGSDTSWRTLSFSPSFTNMSRKKEEISVVRTVSTLHVVRVNKKGAKMCKEMISFDSESETFTRTVLPQSMFSNWSRVWILQWNADLGFGHLDEQGSFHVFVLNDYKNLEWDKEIVFPFGVGLKIKPKLFGSFFPLRSIHGIFHFFVTRPRKIIVYKIASMEEVKIFSIPNTTKDDVNFLGSISLHNLPGMKPQVN